MTLKTSSTNHQKFLPDFSITNDTFLTRDELFANFTFNLASGTIHLKVESGEHGSATRVLYGSDVDGKSHGRPLTRIQFKGLNSLISCKFRSETIVYILQLDEFTVYDDHTTDTIYPKLIYTSTVPGSVASKVRVVLVIEIGHFSAIRCIHRFFSDNFSLNSITLAKEQYSFALTARLVFARYLLFL